MTVFWVYINVQMHAKHTWSIFFIFYSIFIRENPLCLRTTCFGGFHFLLKCFKRTSVVIIGIYTNLQHFGENLLHGFLQSFLNRLEGRGVVLVDAVPVLLVHHLLDLPQSN